MATAQAESGCYNLFMIAPLFLDDVSFVYPESYLPVFEHLSLTLAEGWHAIVGANGSGKSTLLELIAQKARERHCFCTLARQTVEAMDADMEAFLTACTADAYAIKGMLEIADDWLYRFDTLSHGQRKRLQMGAALFTTPDVLLVDEPSNHLDESGKQLLLVALRSFHGIGVLVSHDRAFMDALCFTTSILEHGTLHTYHARPSEALLQHRNVKTFQKTQQRHLETEQKRLTSSMRQLDEQIRRTPGRLSKRHISPQDHDAKEKINAARLTGRDRNDTRALKRLQSRQQHLETRQQAVAKEYAIGVTIETAPQRLFPLTLQPARLDMGDKVLFVPRITIQSGEKIHLEGANGTGKSTFFAYLVAQLPSEGVCYIPQELTAAEISALLKTVLALDDATKGNIFTLMTRLGSDAKKLLQSAQPSSGEARKLMLSLEILRHPALMILDEPTNHMDIVAIEALESALCAYEGTLLFTSHDARFSKTVANRHWEIVVESGTSTHTLECP